MYVGNKINLGTPHGDTPEYKIWQTEHHTLEKPSATLLSS